MPVRIQLKRKKGFRMPVDAVNCARPGVWGNPFVVEQNLHGSGWVVFLRPREKGAPDALLRDILNQYAPSPFTDQQDAFKAAVRCHGEAFDTAIFRESARHFLRGKNLACWCPIKSPHCHVDNLLRWANGQAIG